MANVIIDDTSLVNIADAIREKSGSTDVFLPGEMANAILNLATNAGWDVVTKSGFKPTVNGTAEIVNHNLGRKPRFIIWKTNTRTSPSTSTNYSSYYESLFSVSIYNETTDTYTTTGWAVQHSRFSYYSTASATTPSYMDKLYLTSSTGGTSVNVNSITENTFTTPSYIRTNAGYTYWVIG